MASSKLIPCFFRFAAFLARFHSNIQITGQSHLFEGVCDVVVFHFGLFVAFVIAHPLLRTSAGRATPPRPLCRPGSLPSAPSAVTRIGPCDNHAMGRARSSAHGADTLPALLRAPNRLRTAGSGYARRCPSGGIHAGALRCRLAGRTGRSLGRLSASPAVLPIVHYLARRTHYAPASPAVVAAPAPWSARLRLRLPAWRTAPRARILSDSKGDQWEWRFPLR